MTDILMTLVNGIGISMVVLGYIWSLFGAFRCSSLVGWMFMFFPPLGALAWVILEWDNAKSPIAINILGSLLLMANGFFL